MSDAPSYIDAVEKAIDATPIMTADLRAAWIAGRDAASHCVYLARIGEADPDFRCIISNIRALTPPDALTQKDSKP